MGAGDTGGSEEEMKTNEEHEDVALLELDGEQVGILGLIGDIGRVTFGVNEGQTRISSRK